MCRPDLKNRFLDYLVSSKRNCESQVDLCSSNIMPGSCPKSVATWRVLYSKTNLCVMGGSMLTKPSQSIAWFLCQFEKGLWILSGSMLISYHAWLLSNCESSVDLCSSHIMLGSCPKSVATWRALYSKANLCVMSGSTSIECAGQSSTTYCLICLSVRKRMLNPKWIYAHLISCLALVQIPYPHEVLCIRRRTSVSWVGLWVLNVPFVSWKKDCESQVDLWSSHIMHSSCPNIVVTWRVLYSKTNSCVMSGSMSIECAGQTSTISCLIRFSVGKGIVNPKWIYANLISFLAIVQKLLLHDELCIRRRTCVSWVDVWVLNVLAKPQQSIADRISRIAFLISLSVRKGTCRS